jgi:hypothetical protein
VTDPASLGRGEADAVPVGVGAAVTVGRTVGTGVGTGVGIGVGAGVAGIVTLTGEGLTEVRLIVCAPEPDPLVAVKE